MSRDRDAYELEQNVYRRSVLGYAINSELRTRGGEVLRTEDDDGWAVRLEEQYQQAYKELNRAGLLIGTTYTGRGYRAATDWGLIT